MIIKLITNPNSNSIEVNWIEKEINTISVIVEKDIDGELVRVKEDKELIIESVVHCQSYSDLQIDLLREHAEKFKTTFTEEHEEIIADVIKNIVLPTQEELEAIENEKEKQRILSIKAEAGRIIESRYSIIWQLNHPRMDIAYASEYAWIDSIRAISNEAEINGTALEYIDWGI